MLMQINHLNLSVFTQFIIHIVFILSEKVMNSTTDTLSTNFKTFKKVKKLKENFQGQTKTQNVK